MNSPWHSVSALHRSSALRGSRLLAIGIGLLLLTGCQSTNRLREAQAAFSEAARTDNHGLLAALLDRPGSPVQPGSGQPLPGSAGDQDLLSVGSTRAGYAAALLSLRQLTPRETAQLKSDRLWGTTLTLRALAQWRLGQFEEALKTVHTAESLPEEQLHPRDRTILEILPALVAIDHAESWLRTPAAESDRSGPGVEIWRRRLVSPGLDPRSADERLNHALDRTAADGSMRLYLLMCRLAAYRNFAEIHKKRVGTLPGADDPARVEASHVLQDLSDHLRQSGAHPATLELVLAWKNRFALMPVPRPKAASEE